MGFEDEVFAKYDDALHPDYARELFDTFSSSFDALPLATLVQGKIFVCHGGLVGKPNVTLDLIDRVQRRKEPPLEGPSFQDEIFEHLLWSDPRPSGVYTEPCHGFRPSARGAGVEFGPDVTMQFCRQNTVALIIRSHECVEEGYEVLHDGRLITIFSASRYCGRQQNKGAFITVTNALQPEIQQFFAHKLEDFDVHTAGEKAAKERAAAATAQAEKDLREGKDISGGSGLGGAKRGRERARSLQVDVIRMIVERVCDRKPDLYWLFTNKDREHTGTVSRLEWAEVMRSVLQLDLPFLGYQTKLAETTRDGRINYTQFLDRYRIKMRAEDARWQDGMIQAVCRKLFQSTNARDVDGAFRHFDANDDGCIEYEEFSDTLKSLEIGLDDQQIFQLMCSMDRNRDGTIDLQEFRERFGLCFQQVQLGGKKAAAAGGGGGDGDEDMSDASAGAGATAAAARLARKSSGDSEMTDAAADDGKGGKGRTRMRRAQSVDPHPAARSKMVLRAQSLDDARLQVRSLVVETSRARGGAK